MPSLSVRAEKKRIKLSGSFGAAEFLFIRAVLLNDLCIEE